jgi:hypothetical protein
LWRNQQLSKENSPGFFIYLGLYLFVIKIGMAQSRQLAAIMFTDIVGYTALMGEDEQKAFDLLRKNRQMQGIDRDNPRTIAP